MPLQEVGRLEVRIEATAGAARKVEEIIRAAEPALRSETVERREKANGSIHYVIACNNEAEVDKLLFSIEKVPGAAVHQCV
ncbi:MAG: hypothetical protein HQ592_15345 [Planctomycetes bacterium]|nr:hypothetical protein [Planctomycetota bacterium]